MSFNPRGCSNADCICHKPGFWPVCPKFEYYFTRYCVRCGWERHDHKRPPLIHKGGKP